MGDKGVTGPALLGLIFLAIGGMRFFQGDSWVVWVLLGMVLGGVGALKRILGNKGA